MDTGVEGLEPQSYHDTCIDYTLVVDDFACYYSVHEWISKNPSLMVLVLDTLNCTLELQSRFLDFDSIRCRCIKEKGKIGKNERVRVVQD